MKNGNNLKILKFIKVPTRHSKGDKFMTTAAAVCLDIIDCVKDNIGTQSKPNAEKTIKKLIATVPPFTLDQLVFHCTNMASKANLTEKELFDIIRETRRSNP
jgi:hypothetical protein